MFSKFKSILILAVSLASLGSARYSRNICTDIKERGRLVTSTGSCLNFEVKIGRRACPELVRCADETIRDASRQRLCLTWDRGAVRMRPCQQRLYVFQMWVYRLSYICLNQDGDEQITRTVKNVGANSSLERGGEPVKVYFKSDDGSGVLQCE